MITDEELADLPEDPELAFVEFERIMRAQLRIAEQQEDQNYNADSERLEYINKVIAAAMAYRIDDLSEWEVPRVDSNIYQAYKQFTHDVDHFTTQLRIRHTPRKRRSSVGLDEDTKEKIRNCVEKIRKIIGNADLPESKRESLYTKLNEFSLELDKNRTGLDAGMAVYIAICDGIGRGFEKLEPARRFIDSIAALLGKAKDLEDAGQPKLPSPTERKRLEPPRKALPKPEPRKDELDDVPF